MSNTMLQSKFAESTGDSIIQKLSRGDRDIPDDASRTYVLPSMYNFPLSYGVDITARVHAIVVMTRKSRFLEQRDERKVRAPLTTLSEGLRRNAIAEQSRDKCYTHAMSISSSAHFFWGSLFFSSFSPYHPSFLPIIAIASVIIIPLTIITIISTVSSQMLTTN